MKTYLDQLYELGKQAREYINSQVGTGIFFAQDLNLQEMDIPEVQDQLVCVITTSKHGDMVEYAIKSILPVQYGFIMEVVDLEDLTEETLDDYYLGPEDYCRVAAAIQLSKVITM